MSFPNLLGDSYTLIHPFTTLTLYASFHLNLSLYYFPSPSMSSLIYYFLFPKIFLSYFHQFIVSSYPHLYGFLDITSTPS